MDLITQLESLLEFSPVLLAAFGGLSMLIVQTLKSVSKWFTDHAIVAVLVLTTIFAGLITFEITWALEMAVLTYLLMTVAMGIYSGSKNKVEINLADMDEHDLEK